jgi:hypothetical protein
MGEARLSARRYAANTLVRDRRPLSSPFRQLPSAAKVGEKRAAATTSGGCGRAPPTARPRVSGEQLAALSQHRTSARPNPNSRAAAAKGTMCAHKPTPASVRRAAEAPIATRAPPGRTPRPQRGYEERKRAADRPRRDALVFASFHPHPVRPYPTEPTAAVSWAPRLTVQAHLPRPTAAPSCECQ